MTTSPLKTVSVASIAPILLWEAGLRRVHICGQTMGNLYIFHCGSTTANPTIPENPTQVGKGMICKKCLAQLQVSFETVLSNTLQSLGGEYPIEVVPAPKKPNLRLLNYTGHPITILDVHGNHVMDIHGDGTTGWINHNFITRPETWLGNIVVKDLHLSVDIVIPDGSPKGRRAPFPQPQAGVIYIVEAKIATVLQGQGRTDVYSPGPIIKNHETKEIIGCVGLAQHVLNGSK